MPISGIGGIQAWQDAVEFLLLGAGSVQVCTAVMHYGFRIVEHLASGLEGWMREKGSNTYLKPSSSAIVRPPGAPVVRIARRFDVTYAYGRAVIGDTPARFVTAREDVDLVIAAGSSVGADDIDVSVDGELALSVLKLFSSEIANASGTAATHIKVAGKIRGRQRRPHRRHGAAAARRAPDGAALAGPAAGVRGRPDLRRPRRPRPAQVPRQLRHALQRAAERHVSAARRLRRRPRVAARLGGGAHVEGRGRELDRALRPGRLGLCRRGAHEPRARRELLPSTSRSPATRPRLRSPAVSRSATASSSATSRRWGSCCCWRWPPARRVRCATSRPPPRPPRSSCCWPATAATWACSGRGCSDTVIGIVVGLLVNLLVWPPLRDRTAARQVDVIDDRLGELLSDIARGMRDGRDAQEAERWVERTRELDQDIADAWAVFRQARESGRLNLRRAAAARVDASHALVPLLARLEQAVADTRSMAGTIGRAAASGGDWDPRFREQWLALVARAGAAVSEADAQAITRAREDLESVARGLFAGGRGHHAAAGPRGADRQPAQHPGSDGRGRRCPAGSRTGRPAVAVGGRRKSIAWGSQE